MMLNFHALKNSIFFKFNDHYLIDTLQERTLGVTLKIRFMTQQNIVAKIKYVKSQTEYLRLSVAVILFK